MYKIELRKVSLELDARVTIGICFEESYEKEAAVNVAVAAVMHLEQSTGPTREMECGDAARRVIEVVGMDTEVASVRSLVEKLPEPFRGASMAMLQMGNMKMVVEDLVYRLSKADNTVVPSEAEKAALDTLVKEYEKLGS